MKRLKSRIGLVCFVALAWLLPTPRAHAGEEFPITVEQVKKELGPSTRSDPVSVDYQDKLNVNVSGGSMGLVVRPAGVELAIKLFKSKLFTEAEGKAFTDLLRTRGEKDVGRYEVTALSSVQEEGTVLIQIKPAGKAFPITLAQIKNVLGPPTESGDYSVEYRDKLKLRVSRAVPPAFPQPWIELTIRPAGVEQAAKLLKSKLFTEAEGRAITDLLLKENLLEEDALGKNVGRFVVSREGKGTIHMRIRLAGLQ